MSDLSDMSDREGLAAEYVLGTLPLAERLQAERLIASDADFAALVADWQNRLAPLNEAYVLQAPSPDLLNRIESRLFPAPGTTSSRWRMPFFGALAAAVAAFMLVAYWPTSPDRQITATLVGENQALVVAARFDPDAGQLTFTRAQGPGAGDGKDYELWVIPAGQPAVSLGVLRDNDLTVQLASLPVGTTLAVTLEQTGGSPTGVAQGPLLVATVIGG